MAQRFTVSKTIATFASTRACNFAQLSLAQPNSHSVSCSSVQVTYMICQKQIMELFTLNHGSTPLEILNIIRHHEPQPAMILKYSYQAFAQIVLSSQWLSLLHQQNGHLNDLIRSWVQQLHRQGSFPHPYIHATQGNVHEMKSVIFENSKQSQSQKNSMKLVVTGMLDLQLLQYQFHACRSPCTARY